MKKCKLNGLAEHRQHRGLIFLTAAELDETPSPEISRLRLFTVTTVVFRRDQLSDRDSVPAPADESPEEPSWACAFNTYASLSNRLDTTGSAPLLLLRACHIDLGHLGLCFTRGRSHSRGDR